MPKEAMYYEKHENNTVRCLLCPHNCVISDGGTGFCRVRRNDSGTLYSLIYGLCAAQALDPIEKKPLRHFMPGSTIYSIGNVGCNLACAFCQNHGLSQENPPCFALSPEDVLLNAQRLRENKNIGVAFTYAEPTVWYEYVCDTAKLLQEGSLKAVLVTNGFIEREPLQALLPYIDAMNIDVKAFNEEFYRKVCGSGKKGLSTVKNSVEAAIQAGCHVEVTTLIIPGLNDDAKEMEELAKWLSELGRTASLHLSRYFPRYRLQVPVTPVDTLKKLREVAVRYIKNVHIGNV